MPSTLYRCNVCGATYESESDAAICEGTPQAPPRYAPGDVVYVSEGRKFVRRVVADVLAAPHAWQYGLDIPYEAANGMLWGVPGPRSGRYAGRCHESQLVSIGDDVIVGGQTVPLTKEMLDE